MLDVSCPPHCLAGHEQHVRHSSLMPWLTALAAPIISTGFPYAVFSNMRQGAEQPAVTSCELRMYLAGSCG